MVLPLQLLDSAVKRLQDPALERVAYCSLDEHGDEHHFAALDSLTRDVTLWVRWHGTGVELVELRDCVAQGPEPEREVCALFAGHAGRHTRDSPGARHAHRGRREP